MTMSADWEGGITGARSTEEIRLETFFQGHTRAWGVFQDLFGNLRRRFEVEIDGAWDGDVLTLTEHFTYDDGEREVRVWKIAPTADGYEGTAEGVHGTARGKRNGPAFGWSYVFDLDLGGFKLPVRFDDRFFRVGQTLVNRAKVSKFGIPLGEAMICFRRADLGEIDCSCHVHRAAAE
jgi:hypothetical protein